MYVKGFSKVFEKEYANTSFSYVTVLLQCLQQVFYIQLYFDITIYSISGLLLGVEKSKSQWEIVDSLALFHSNPLAPLLEIAMLQV
jgi:hypothetical protein